MDWSEKRCCVGVDKITLPLSKSILNRLLAVEVLASGYRVPEELALACDDTRNMFLAVRSRESLISAGESGTAMRFLLALFSAKKFHHSEVTLTGENRLLRRPIGSLVEALRQMGADIEYLEESGFLPVRIKPKRLSGGSIKINSNQSSQFVSALMLIAPTIDGGLSIELPEKQGSRPYIYLTADVMRDCGVEVEFYGNKVTIAEQSYKPYRKQVESDFSSLSFWYAFVAVSEGLEELQFGDFYPNSHQPDSRIIEIMQRFGIETEFVDNSLIIRKEKGFLERFPKEFSEDFSQTPDLVPVLSAMCCLLGVRFEFRGVENLRIKESDRLRALEQELGRCGYDVLATENTLVWQGRSRGITTKKILASAHSDHRIAMALALLQQRKSIEIDHPETVKKSYPNFWDDLEKVKEI